MTRKLEVKTKTYSELEKRAAEKGLTIPEYVASLAGLSRKAVDSRTR